MGSCVCLPCLREPGKLLRMKSEEHACPSEAVSSLGTEVLEVYRMSLAIVVNRQRRVYALSNAFSRETRPWNAMQK